MVSSSVSDVSSRLVHAATLIHNAAQTSAATIGSAIAEIAPRPQPTEASRQEAEAIGREVDLRTFERTYIIPVGFFAAGRSVPPLTARRSVEPPTAVRGFHGVLAGPASSANNTQHRQIGRPASSPMGEASSLNASDDVLEAPATLLRTQPLLHRVQEPREAFRPPVAVGEVFDQRA